MSLKSASKKKRWSWRSQAFRGLIYQIVAIGVMGCATFLFLVVVIGRTLRK